MLVGAVIARFFCILRVHRFFVLKNLANKIRLYLCICVGYLFCENSWDGERFDWSRANEVRCWVSDKKYRGGAG